MRPQISNRLSGLLTSSVVAGFLIAGSAAFAQHGNVAGSHGSFGGAVHGRFGGGVHSGFASHTFSGSAFGNPGRISALAPHAIATPGRSIFPPSSRAFAPGFARNWTGSQPAWRNRGWRDGGWRDGGHGRDHDHGYGYGGYGYPGVYPYYANSWELLPYDLGGSDFMGGDTDPTTAQQGSPQPAESIPPPDAGYRPEYSENEPEPYPVQQAYAVPSAPAAPIAPEPELTLIFRDGHTQTIHNYVLTPSNLVVLDQASAGRQQQIPLDELNLPATERAARQAGLDFSPPA